MPSVGSSELVACSQILLNGNQGTGFWFFQTGNSYRGIQEINDLVCIKESILSFLL